MARSSPRRARRTGPAGAPRLKQRTGIATRIEATVEARPRSTRIGGTPATAWRAVNAIRTTPTAEIAKDGRAPAPDSAAPGFAALGVNLTALPASTRTRSVTAAIRQRRRRPPCRLRRCRSCSRRWPGTASPSTLPPARPYRCNGTRAAPSALIFSGVIVTSPDRSACSARICSSERIMRVSIGDGLTVLTRMPSGAHSSAAERIIPITACLLVV